MKVVINEERALGYLPADGRTALMLPLLEGQRRWTQTGAFSFIPTPHNLDIIREYYPQAKIEDRRAPSEDEVKVTAALADAAAAYAPKVKNYSHQEEAFQRCKDAVNFALFMEQGTGKSKVAVDKASYLWLKGQITGVLVIAPRGVHIQWPEEAVPTYTPDTIPWSAYAWKKKELPAWCLDRSKLRWFSINFDALKTDAGMASVQAFIKAHKGRVLGIGDETQAWANARSERTKAAYSIRDLLAYRMILTGTPIATELANEWAQFKWLDEDIIGIRYITAFRAQYCRMGGFMNRAVIGYRNLDQFKKKVEPYMYRVTKAEALDLPKKIYSQFVFEMSPAQRKRYDELKDTYMVQLDEAKRKLGIDDLSKLPKNMVASIPNAALLIMRLQQITCGFLPMDDDSIIEFENPRLQALKDLINTRQDKKIIIWARFKQDIKYISDALGNDCLRYTSDLSQDERQEAKHGFIDGPKRFFLSTAEVGGTGLDGFQKVCRFAIYYANSYKAIPRWQSEDRIDRIGSVGPSEYADLICKGGPDRKILANLRRKASLSDLSLSSLHNIVIDGDAMPIEGGLSPEDERRFEEALKKEPEAQAQISEKALGMFDAAASRRKGKRVVL